MSHFEISPCVLNCVHFVYIHKNVFNCIKNKLIFKERRDLVIEKLSKIDGIQADVPDGAFYIFPSCENMINKKTPSGTTIKNCTDFAKYLLEDVLVAVVPGIAFGAENFFRISSGLPIVVFLP